MSVANPVPRGQLLKIKSETEYYDHQAKGVRTMARMRNFLLADEMGLGKSLQALTVAAIDYELGMAKRVLVIAPATLKWNWEDEIVKFTNFTYLVLDGTPDDRLDQLEFYEVTELDILIVNYEQVTAHLEDLNKLRFDIIIYDEAHAIKNYRAKRTKASLKLSASRHFAITGSPLLNQVNELWPILHRLDPVTFPDYWRFVNRYAVKGGFQNKQIVGVKNKQELQGHIDRLMIRRLKKDTLDLPDKQYVPVPVDFHPEQEKLYREAADELKISRFDGDPDPMEIENALVKATYLKQICGTTATKIEPDYSHKLDMAVEMCKVFTKPSTGETGEHIVVFSQFIKVMECLRDRLEAEGVPVMVMNGQTVPKEHRIEFVKGWAAQPKPTVLIAGLAVSGVGMNMTAANKCIFIDKLWVPKLNEQAEDRLHRIGADLTKPIQIFHIYVRNSIEGRVEAILKKKKKLFDSLVEESDWKKALYQALVEEEEVAA